MLVGAPPKFLLSWAHASGPPVPKLQSTYPVCRCPFPSGPGGCPSPHLWTSSLGLLGAACSFIPHPMRLHSTKNSSHFVLAPPPGHRKDPQPHARDLHQAGAVAARRKTPGPGRVNPVGTVCLENRNPGRGAGRGAPSPPQSASCPSRLPPCDTQAGRRAWGCRGGGGLPHQVPTPPVAQPPARGHALWGGRGGVKRL